VSDRTRPPADLLILRERAARLRAPAAPDRPAESLLLEPDSIVDVLAGEVEARRPGPVDYVLKGKIGGLGPAVRRAAQVRRLRPDLRFIDFRGNVETRLRKLEEGLADATLLALAGLERLGLASHVTSVLSAEEMLPAVAQGAIGITSRTDDATTRSLLEPLNDARSATAVACERAFLARLDGSCKTPIAGLAEIEDGILHFRGMILTPDGTQWHEVGLTGAAEHARNIGSDAGEELLAHAGPEFHVKLA